MKKAQLRLLYFVTEDWYFCSHRLALAKAARQAGFEVFVVTRIRRHGDIIRAAGITAVPLNVVRGGINPFKEIVTLIQVAETYWKLKPDLVHHVALKPVLYGGIVTLFMPGIKVVNLLAGLGAIFSSQHWKSRLLKPVVEQLFRVLFRRSDTFNIVQNKEDYAVLQQRLQVPPASIRLIKGSGVDIEKFHPTAGIDDTVSIALVSRLLWDKGIADYLAAVKLLKQQGLNFNAFLVGKPDPESMSSVTSEQLHIWNEEGDVRCLGHIDDIAEFWQRTHIAVLPSFYGEGVPKCLIEAAACGRPIVTTDSAGCNEIVENGVNGLLIPVRDVNALAHALEKLILDERLRMKMGQAGRQKVEREFSNEVVLNQTIDIYRKLLS